LRSAAFDLLWTYMWILTLRWDKSPSSESEVFATSRHFDEATIFLRNLTNYNATGSYEPEYQNTKYPCGRHWNTFTVTELKSGVHIKVRPRTGHEGPEGE
jgi:hypothetical protein